MAFLPQWPLLGVQAAFNVRPVDTLATAQWADLTARVTKLETTAGRQYELAQVETGTASLELVNTDEALTPANTGSAYNTGGNSLVPYRRLRIFAGWPLSGNILNAGNQPWAVGNILDSAGFEGGTLGDWVPHSTGGATAPTLANSTTRAHDGTHSMLITWATNGAGFTASASLPLPPLVAGRTYTASAWVWVVAGPSVRLGAQTALSASSSGTGAWQRLTVTWVATDGTFGLSIVPTSATTSGQTVYVDSFQVELGSSATTYGTTGTIIYPIMAGYIERYPGTWTHRGYHGWANFTAVDSLAAPPRAILSDCMRNDVIQDAPSHWFTLTEAAAPPLDTGNQAWDDAGPPRFSFVGVVSPTTPSPAWGVAGGPGVDGFTSPQWAPSGGGTGTWSQGWWHPVGSSAVTYEIWINTTSTTEVAATLNSSDFQEWQIGVTAGGLPVARVTSSTSPLVYAYTLTGTATVNDGAWHHICMTETVSAGTVTGILYVDGVQQDTDTRSAATVFNAASIQLAYSYWSTDLGVWTGKLSFAAIYPTALAATRVAAHAASGNGHFGDTTGQRISRILDWIAWPGATAIDAGRTQCGAASGLAGTNPADAIGTCAATESGAFLAEPSGALAFYGRDHFYLETASTVTFGENSAGGEIPYLEDVSLGTDPQFLINNVTVTGSTGNPQTAEDTTSQDSYFLSSTSITGIHAYDQDASTQAAHTLANLKDPHERVISVTVQPSTDSTLWPTVLGTKFGDRVTVIRRTPVATYSINGYVSNIRHASQGLPDWTVTYQVTPVEPLPWIIGDATYGVIGTTTISRY